MFDYTAFFGLVVEVLGPALVVLRALAEISLIALAIYGVLYFMRGTRSVVVLAGIAILLFGMKIISVYLGMSAIDWLLDKVGTVITIFLLIVFQPEIRRALAELGSQQPLSLGRPQMREAREVVDVLVNTAFFLATHRIGALIAIEKDIGMRAIAETGTAVNAPLSQELLSTFFFPNTPLHDGGVIVKGDMIQAAACIFPLSDSPEFSRNLGTRHRAAVGLTEETDALVVVVSEETGAVSLAYQGRLLRGLERGRLTRHLRTHLRRRRAARENTMATALQAVTEPPRDGIDEEPHF